MTGSSAGEEPLSLAVDAIESAARGLGASPRTRSQGVRDAAAAAHARLRGCGQDPETT